MNPNTQYFFQKVAARYRKNGLAATLRAITRSIIRRILNRLEIKDYGYTTDFRAIAKSGSQNDWLYWQQELAAPVRPYIGLSEAAAASGDMVRADEILLSALTEFPNNSFLLESYCRLALESERWGEAVRRWELLKDKKFFVSPHLVIPVALALLQIGSVHKADALISELRTTNPHNIKLLHVEALLAEAEGEWLRAAEIWRLRGRQTKSSTNSYSRSVRALINAGALSQAEEEAQALVKRFPKNTSFLKLLAEVAIASDSWVVALERWRNVEESHPDSAGLMPSEWVYRIGVDNARERTEAIKIGRLRATGMLSIAMAIKSVDEVAALTLGRQARAFYAEAVNEMTANLLFVNSRNTAAIWWATKLISTSGKPKKYYPLLVEALISASRFEDCEVVLDEYIQRYNKDSLWLRAMVEIYYRRNDFGAMCDVMELAVAKKLKPNVNAAPVMRWLYDLIRLHPTPDTFVPASLHGLILRTTTIYDGKFLSDSLGMLLDPARGDAVVEIYVDMIAKDAAGESEIAAVQREEILQFFIRRRQWEHVQSVLDLPMRETLDARSAKKTWNIIRNKIDIRLVDADVDGAEAVAVDFLDQLIEHQLHAYAMSLSHMMLARLPTSELVANRLLVISEKLGFTQMTARLSVWKERYANFAPRQTVGIAKKKRCFIVGNGPSIADMPLHALAGEDIFCVNRGMRALDVGLPAPKYLVVADPLVYKNHASEIDSDGASVEKFFVATNCLWRKPPTVPVIPVGSSGLSLSLAPFKPAPLHMHRGHTVIVIAAQIAHLMGYKEIYIIGVDLDYSGPVTHFYGGGHKETERLGNFRPGGSGTELVNLALANLQEVIAADGCKLYNAAPGGKLDMIERVNFSDVLDISDQENFPKMKEAEA